MGCCFLTSMGRCVPDEERRVVVELGLQTYHEGADLVLNLLWRLKGKEVIRLIRVVGWTRDE